MESKEINTKVLLNFLSEYNLKQDYSIRTCRRYNKLLDHRREMLQTILSVKKAIEDGSIDEDQFLPGIVRIDWCAELLWYLGMNGLIDVTEYFIIKNDKKGYLQNLTFDLVNYYFFNDNSAFVAGIRSFMTSKISSICQENDTFIDDDANKLVLTQFASSFSARLALDDVSPEHPIPLLEDDNIDSQSYHRLISIILMHCLKDKGRTAQNAMSSQDYYSPAHGTTCARFLEKAACIIPEKMLSALILQFFMGCNESSKVSWNSLAVIIHSALKINPSFHKSIIHGLVEDSLKQFTSWKLYAAFVIGRICTLKGCCLTMTYLQWFSSTFSSDSHRPLDTDDKAKFFLRSMSDVLCAEPTSFTKVHIHKVASVPSTCQGDLSEYLQMARTLLKSLNESIELGFFESTEDGTAAENDIRCLLNHYRANKKLPQHFLSAINFRKQYFDREFLPKMMSSCPGVTSDQHSILKQLAGMGKISASLISKHTESCTQKSRK